MHEFAKCGSVNQSRGTMAVQVWIRNHGVVQLEMSQEKRKDMNVK